MKAIFLQNAAYPLSIPFQQEWTWENNCVIFSIDTVSQVETDTRRRSAPFIGWTGCPAGTAGTNPFMERITWWIVIIAFHPTPWFRGVLTLQAAK